MFSRPQIDTLVKRADGFTAKAAATPKGTPERDAYIYLALADYHEALGHTLRFQIETSHDDTARELSAFALAIRESIFWVGHHAFTIRSNRDELEPQDTFATLAEFTRPLKRTLQPA